MKHTAIIGLGANIENPLNQIKEAIDFLKKSDLVKVKMVSSLYGSKPVGPQDQPDFVNAVISLETELEPHDLLDYLQSIEQLHKRVRKQHWGPRTLDLDILYIDNAEIHTDRLTVPHPEILNRAFVVIPLLEILPLFTLPTGEQLRNHQSKLPKEDVEALRILEKF